MVKLARLPDRTPIKLVISVLPELNDALVDYAAAYKHAYGREESVVDLIPAMLASFLESDRAFVKARQAKRSGL